MTTDAYAKAEGRRAAQELWDGFLETANAENLPLTPASAQHLAADRATALEIMDPVETQRFIVSYANGLSAALDRKMKAFLPLKWRGRLHHFCMLAFWIESGSTYHPEESMASYGLGLYVPGRKTIVRPETVKRQAERDARADARRDWKAFLSTPEPIPGRIHWTGPHRELGAQSAFIQRFDYPAGMEWPTPESNRLAKQWDRAWSKVYKSEMERLIRKWMPDRLRKMAGHVCALATRLGLHIRKSVKLPDSSRTS